jgi:thiol-disulfide isomerase/thioredoxin
MKRAAGALGALAVVLLAAWAGRRAHLAELHAQEGVAVPAGEASAPVPLPQAIPGDAAPEPGLVTSRSIPERLPPFSLHDRAGVTTPISTWQGKSLIINFWATWCAPCRREMPLLQALDNTWAGRNFRVIGIAVDHRDAVLKFASSLQIGYPLLIGEEDALDVATSLGVTTPALPFTVFTDRRGQIVALYIGELHKPESDLILSTVLEVNQDLLAVDAARERIAAQLAKLHTAAAA